MKKIQEKFNEKKKPYLKPTLVNKLKKQRRWANYVKGTRQIDLVTLG